MIPSAPPPPALVTTCRVADVPAHGEWSLAREGAAESPRWVLLLRRGPVASAPARMPLSSAASIVSADRVDDPATVSCTFEPPLGPPRQDEWMAGVGAAWSIDLLQSAGGRRYVPVTVSWGRDVMRDAGPGFLRGRLMWAIELMPVYWQQAPTTTIGMGFSPLVWRWRFVPRARAAPFAELAFGGLFTSDPVPEGTEAANFIAHGGFGVRWRPASGVSLVTAYRFQHISNGNQLPTNPGVNAHVLWIGLAFGGRAPS